MDYNECMSKSYRELQAILTSLKVKGRSKLTRKRDMCNALVEINSRALTEDMNNLTRKFKNIELIEDVPMGTSSIGVETLDKYTLISLLVNTHDIVSLLNLCQTNNTISSICRSELFWKHKIIQFNEKYDNIIKLIDSVVDKQSNETKAILTSRYIVLNLLVPYWIHETNVSKKEKINLLRDCADRWLLLLTAQNRDDYNYLLGIIWNINNSWEEKPEIIKLIGELLSPINQLQIDNLKLQEILSFQSDYSLLTNVTAIGRDQLGIYIDKKQNHSGYYTDGANPVTSFAFFNILLGVTGEIFFTDSFYNHCHQIKIYLYIDLLIYMLWCKKFQLHSLTYLVNMSENIIIDFLTTARERYYGFCQIFLWWLHDNNLITPSLKEKILHSKYEGELFDSEQTENYFRNNQKYNLNDIDEDFTYENAILDLY